MSEATLRSATGAYIGRASIDNDSRPSPAPSPHLPSAILHTTPQDEPTQSVPQEEQSTSVTRPPFSPFYTLINDSGNSTTHHPINVHYIFSDDDTDILTNACLAAVPGPSSQSSSGLTARSASSSMASPSKEQPNINARPSSKSGPHQSISKEPEQRTILIDLDETGTQITSAQCLTSSWQVMSTNLSPAPTWEEGPSSENDAGTARFMLSIEGLNGLRQDAGRQAGKEVTGEDFKALADEFDKRMAMLRIVVEAGDKRLGIDRESEEGQSIDAAAEPGEGKDEVKEGKE